MKILVLTKRQYMGKDLLDDRFGRFRELPLPSPATAIVKNPSYCSYGDESLVGTKIRADDSSMCCCDKHI